MKVIKYEKRCMKLPAHVVKASQKADTALDAVNHGSGKGWSKTKAAIVAHRKAGNADFHDKYMRTCQTGINQFYPSGK